MDFNNPLCSEIHECRTRIFFKELDIFELSVVQCITPDTPLPNVNNDLEGRSPQELAAFHTYHRALKRMVSGERIWMVEHDAYLRPEGEEFFHAWRLSGRL